MISFAVRLKELRHEKNLTQKQLAEALGIHQTTIKDWETQRYRPSFEMLAALAAFFNITTDYLLGITN